MDIPKKLAISSRITGGVVVFDIEGELSRLTAVPPTLSELVASQLQQGQRRVLFNFEATLWVDSFGVQQMLACYSSIQDLGGALKICRVPPKLQVILEVTGLVKVLDVHPTESSALGAFAAFNASGHG